MSLRLGGANEPITAQRQRCCAAGRAVDGGGAVSVGGQSCPDPKGLHCHGGADRTGLVSAITKLTLEKTTIPEAKKELSLRYGHFPYFLWNSARAMDESFNSFTHDKYAMDFIEK